MLTLVLVLVLAAAAGAVYQFLGLRRSRRLFPPRGRMVDIGPERLHVACAGEGDPAVVFESAIAASSLSWTRVLPEVATFTRTCAYDRAGLGWSSAARTPRTLTAILNDLDGVIVHEAVPPAVLVGHSFGAFLVCAYAARFPTSVAGIVLLDPPSEWHELTARRDRLLWGGIQMSRLGAVLARLGVVRVCLSLLTGGAPGVPRQVVRLFGPTTARTLERMVGEVRKLPADVHPSVQSHWSDPKCFGAMADYLGALQETSRAVAAIDALPNVPLVILSSGDQPAEVLASHQRLAGLSPQGHVIVASNSAHWIQFDEPALVVAAVHEVVTRVRQSREPRQNI